MTLAPDSNWSVWYDARSRFVHTLDITPWYSSVVNCVFSRLRKSGDGSGAKFGGGYSALSNCERSRLAL
jgi:hypothetical protein